MQVELGYRKNPKPVLTSADEILSANKPDAEFAQLVKDAEGGTLFIDGEHGFGALNDHLLTRLFAHRCVQRPTTLIRHPRDRGPMTVTR